MWRKIRIPLVAILSAALGAGGVWFFMKPKAEEPPASSAALIPKKGSGMQSNFDSILKDQEKLFKNFDSMFNDDFFRHDDPFEEMRKFRERLHGEFRPKKSNPLFSSPFDSWYEDKFGGGSVEEISKREDDKYVYYDIKLPDVEGSSVKTNVENGYLTITGEVKKSKNADKGGGVHSFYQSSFRRTIPLPEDVIGEQMEMVSEKDKLVLKFPKQK